MIDINPPTVGPQGFGTWSYLGAIATSKDSATVPYFKVCNGSIIFDHRLCTATTSSLSYTAITLTVPETTRHAYLEIGVVDTNSGGTNASICGSGDEDVAYLITQVVNFQNWITAYIPVSGSKNNTIYAKVSHATTTVLLEHHGWAEDIEEFP